MKMVRVQRMPTTVDYAGKKWGPSDGPISIPENLANALGLQPVEGDSAAQVAAQESGASPEVLARTQENLDTLLHLLAPEAKDGEQPDDVLRRVLGERDGQARALQGIRATRESVVQERDTLREQVGTLTRERDEFRQGLQTAQRDRDDLDQQVRELKAQYDEAIAELEPLRSAPLLSPDARERLIKVKGISEALADAALAALTPKAE